MHSQGGTACFIEQVVVMHDSMQLLVPCWLVIGSCLTRGNRISCDLADCLRIFGQLSPLT